MRRVLNRLSSNEMPAMGYPRKDKAWGEEKFYQSSHITFLDTDLDTDHSEVNFGDLGAGTQ